MDTYIATVRDTVAEPKTKEEFLKYMDFIYDYVKQAGGELDVTCDAIVNDNKVRWDLAMVQLGGNICKNFLEDLKNCLNE